MGDAPTLPAQTPGMFVGGGGSGDRLSGECAQAVADAGLSETDLGSFEEVHGSVSAAQLQCRNYDSARFLDEAERRFDASRARASEGTSDEARLPTARERHLSMCVPAPWLPASLFRARADDPSTNVPAGRDNEPPGAFGFDPTRAMHLPFYQGPAMRTALPQVLSSLVPALCTSDTEGRLRRQRPGTPVAENVIARLSRHAIDMVLAAAMSEDRPRLRAADLTSSRRPRRAEAEHREAQSSRPAPPRLAASETVSVPAPSAVDGAADDHSGDGASAPPGGGCVSGLAQATVSSMRREVSERYAEGYVEEERAVESREMQARVDASRERVELEHTQADARYASRRERPRAQVALREEEARAIGAQAVLGVAAAALGSLAGLREQAFELGRTRQTRSAALSGRVPESYIPLQPLLRQRAETEDG